MIRPEIDLLFQIQGTSPPCPAELPGYEKLYEIDLNTREIQSPQEVVVKKDHNASVFYFTIDRFLDYMDLSTTCCVVLYTVKEQTYIYPIPYYDVYSLSGCNKMILPWILDEKATQQEGDIFFSFKFYKMSGNTSDDAEIIYSLNTKTSKLTIHYGLDAPEITDEISDIPGANTLYSLINEVKNLKETKFVWTEIKED